MGQDYNIFEDSNDNSDEIENSNHNFDGYSGGGYSSSTNEYGLSTDEYMENKGHYKPLRRRYNSDEDYKVAMEEYERIRDEMTAWRDLPSNIMMWIVIIIFGMAFLSAI